MKFPKEFKDMEKYARNLVKWIKTKDEYCEKDLYNSKKRKDILTHYNSEHK